MIGAYVLIGVGALIDHCYGIASVCAIGAVFGLLTSK